MTVLAYPRLSSSTMTMIQSTMQELSSQLESGNVSSVEATQACLSHIENNDIEGCLWVTGDFHYGSISKVGAGLDVGHRLYEVMVGPTGSFLSFVGAAMVETEQYLMGFSEWNHTRFECNPSTGIVLVQYISDEGNVIAEMNLQV